MTIKTILAAVILALLCSCASRPVLPTPPDPSRLAAADLLADVDVLQHAYETLHPGLYRYNTPAQMARHFASLRRELGHDQSLSDAYLAFSVFAATVRCGHTYANFYNQPKAIQQALFERRNRVPFYFRWLDGRMIVTRNFSADASLAAGVEITSINGVPTHAILERLVTVARADGSNDAKRLAWLQVQGEDTYEAFDIFLPLFFPQTGATLTLGVRDPGRVRERRIEVAAMSYAERLATRPVETESEGPVWTLDQTDPAIAVLRMPTWALYNSHWDWKGWLQATFKSLERAGTPSLVIDLRANEGGQDVGNVLLAHLVEQDLRLPEQRHLVRYRKVPDDLAPFLDTWDPTFKDWGAAAVPFDQHYYRLTRWDDDASGNVVHPEAPRYSGRVFVLIGPTNSSATFEFAQAMSQSRRGTLVGRPTGGNRRGINGGAFFFLRLPHSGIELDLPLIAQFPVTPQPDAGISPDIETTISIADVVDARDVDMQAVREMLERAARGGARR